MVEVDEVGFKGTSKGVLSDLGIRLENLATELRCPYSAACSAMAMGSSSTRISPDLLSTVR